jgi:hypothetical protein
MGASTEVVSNPRLSRPASGESLTRHRARPRVGHRLTGCSTVAVKRGSTALPYLTFYLQNSTFWRTDERTRTADLISLRVITQALQGVAEACKFRISIGVSFLRVAACCTVLRSRWYQSGIRTSGSCTLTVGPMARTRDLRSHNPPTLVSRRCRMLQNQLI